MKNIFAGIVVLCMGLSVNGQQKMQIKLCDKMEEFKDGAQFSIVTDHDTLVVPQLDKTKFVNPLNMSGTGGSYDKSDTSRVTLIIENYKYRYAIQVDRQDIFCGYLGVCAEPAKHNKKLSRWSYQNCQSLSLVGYTQLEKKKR